METNENNFLKAVEALISLRESAAYNDLGALIDERMKPQRDTSRSTELNELFTALAKAQSEMLSAQKSSENPYFKSKYADLEEVVTSSRPSLTKNGLSVLQQIVLNDDGQSLLHTILAHSSGQFIESRMRIVPPKNDIQSFGSYLTFLRRYSYAALIGVVTGEQDDDGEVAMIEARQMVAKGPSNKYNPKEQSFEVITKEQLEEFEYELQGCPDIAEQIFDSMRIQSLADLPKSKYQVCIQRVREIKNARAGKK
jgi:ERF superfamily